MREGAIRWKRIAFNAGLAVLLLSVILGASSCSRANYTGPVASISIAYAPYAETALYWIAQDQRLFTKNGLNVTMHPYAAILTAVNAMLKGEVDIVGNVAEFQLASQALANANIAALASVAQSNNTYLVARKDRAIAQVSDLRGKRIGILGGTITDFYLGRLLELNGMGIKDVTRVDVKTAGDSVKAIVSGDVDAIVIAQPYANSAIQQLGANSFFQSAQSDQSLYALAVSTAGWISKNPEQAARFLRALTQAEDYLNRNPAQSKVIVEKELSYDSADLETYWPQIQFGLTLDQSLILAMEDEARWLISNNMTTRKTVPNFLDSISADGLKSVNPNAVRIVGK